MLDAASVVKPVGSTLSLWYAGLIGAIGVAGGGDAATPVAARS